MSKVFTPEEILPIGDDYTMATNPFTGISGKARKGIIVATLNNIASLNQLLPSSKEIDQIEAIKKAITDLLPSLKVTGIFDLFSIKEWMSNPQQLGRIYTGVLYLKSYPEELTEQLMRQLKEIRANTSSLVLQKEIDQLRL